MSKKKKNLSKKATPKNSSSKINKRKSKVLTSKHWVSVIIILITAFCFLPSLDNDFVNWDDDKNIYENTDITDLSKGSFATQTASIFSNTVIGNYNPLTIWTFAIEERIFGLDNPFYWHLINYLLHLLCTFLVFRLCTILKMNWKIAAITSLLFGIHPMHVESVAWVTERKDVLYGAFYLSALIQYIKYQYYKKSKHLILIYLFFTLALLSKIQAVSLPLTMLAIDYFIKRPLNWRIVLEKIPFFLMALAIGVLGIYLLNQQGSLDNVTTHHAIWTRPFIGSYSFLIYLVKSLVPYVTSPMYPYPSTIPWYFYGSMIGLPFYVGFLFYAWKKEWKYCVFGFLFFIINIIFLLQILGAGQGFIADRFSYISFIGLFVMYAYAIDYYLLESPKLKYFGYLLLGAFTLIYGFLSFNQNKIWKNSGTLWSHVLRYHKNITLPYGNRANYYRDNGQKQSALQDYAMAIKLAPDANKYNSRAKLFFESQNPDTIQLAVNDYTQAIGLEPEIAEFYINRGAGKAKLGRIKDALYDLNKGIRLDPNFSNGYLNRSVIRNRLGEIQGALDDLLKYQEFVPYNHMIAFETGRAFFRLNQMENAIAYFSKAISLSPNVALYYYERAMAYDRNGMNVNAKNDITKAQSFNMQMNPEVVNRILSQ